MPASVVELYTPDAVVTGLSGPGHRGDFVAVDDIIVAVGEVDLRRVVHANWHDVILEAGPCQVAVTLPVLPGFDPGRALTRPGGTFIQFRNARLAIIGHPEAGELERAFVVVNRYAVDHVASDLMLGCFFPAARFETLSRTPAG